MDGFRGLLGALGGLLGALGGLDGVGISGAPLGSGGASSRVRVALRRAFRNLLPMLGCVLGMLFNPCTLVRLPWKLLRLCADSMRVNMAAEVKSLLASKLGRTRSIDMRARSKLGRTRYSVERRLIGGRFSIDRRNV